MLPSTVRESYIQVAMDFIYKQVTLLLLAVPTCCIPANAVNRRSHQMHNRPIIHKYWYRKVRSGVNCWLQVQKNGKEPQEPKLAFSPPCPQVPPSALRLKGGGTYKRVGRPSFLISMAATGGGPGEGTKRAENRKNLLKKLRFRSFMSNSC